MRVIEAEKPGDIGRDSFQSVTISQSIDHLGSGWPQEEAYGADSKARIGVGIKIEM